MNIINRAYSLLADHIKPQGLKVLSLVGFLYLSLKSLSSLQSFYQTFLRFGHNLPQRYGQGSWALVTGAAQGLGAAFAEELARRGFNLILIDALEDKLKETSEAIGVKHPKVLTKTIVCNFTESFNEGFYDSILEQLKDLDISLLVNNVGAGVPLGPFYNTDEQRVLKAITINIIPLTILTRRLIPQMLKRPQRSGIINMSSLNGVLPSAPAAVYSATKAYIDFFSRSIERDISHKIDVISVRPSLISTPSIGNLKPRLYIISAQDAAKGVLKKLGRTSCSYGDWRHEIQGWLCVGVHPFFMDLVRMHFRRFVLVK